MSNTVLNVNLALPLKWTDKVRIHAEIKDDAKEFSVNFVIGMSENDDIAYQFKWRLETATIIDAWRRSGTWHDQKERQHPNFDGKEFALEFKFYEEYIYVYSIHEHRNLITSFYPQYDLDEIKSIQVWDDIATISQLNFLYG